MKSHLSEWAHSGFTCREVTDCATEYLDDKISILTKVRIGQHLVSCIHCRAYVQQIDLVSTALGNLPKLYPSPTNHLRLKQQFAARLAS